MNVTVADTADARAAIRLAERVLDTELRRGCDDRAVYGGLTGFITNWSASHAQDPAGVGTLADYTSELMNIVARYADLKPPDRHGPYPRHSGCCDPSP